MFNVLPDVDVPQFKLYDHSMSSILADDNQKPSFMPIFLVRATP